MASTCTECGSDKMINGVKILDSGQYSYESLRVAMHANPDAKLFKKTEFSELRATICAACGHTTLRATNLDELWAAYQQSGGRGGE